MPPTTPLAQRNTLILYLQRLQPQTAATIWLHDLTHPADLGLAHACDLLDPTLTCFERNPAKRDQIVTDTCARISAFIPTITSRN